MTNLKSRLDLKSYRQLIYITIAALAIGVFTGSLVVLFIKSLNWSIDFRKEHSFIILFLPIIGFCVAWVYKHYGLDSFKGNSLIIDEIHAPKNRIPLRMVPLIFISTCLSHLFGASVGREGAAVQMGGGLSAFFAKTLKAKESQKRLFLMMGMSAGFSAIFGTPVAGAVFGLEVLFVGALAYEALVPCVLASAVAFYTTLYLGVVSTHYFSIAVPFIEIKGVFAAILAGVMFGLTAKLFIWSTHKVKELFSNNIKNSLLHPLAGGILLVILFYLVGSDRYHSLGEEIIHDSFRMRVYPWDFFGKLFSTALSIGSGFKGGEVMSLFYMGSTLGNSLSFILPLDYPVLAALGFVSVFAGATNTPLTGFLLAFELYGSSIGVYAAVAVSFSYLFSGKKGIYHTQVVHREKTID